METIAAILPRVLTALHEWAFAAAPPPKLPRDARPPPHRARVALTMSARSAPRRWGDCYHDADCWQPHALCVKHQCVPHCHDTDATNFTADLNDVAEQAFTPGRTTAYLPHAGPGKTLLWQPIDQVDGCKTSSLLLEYSCMAPDGGAQGSPQFQFHYIFCPPQTLCQSTTDATSGVTAAACVPLPPPPPELTPDCVTGAGPYWMPLGLATNTSPTYALQVHGGTLFAGGTTGVRRWESNTGLWQAINDGFPLPAWGSAPLIVDLATAGGDLFAVMHNAAVDSFFRRNPSTAAWEPAGPTPLAAHVLLPHNDTLFLGTDDGLAWYDPLLNTCSPLDASTDASIYSLLQVGTQLLYGTGTGLVRGIDLDTNATTPFDAFSPTGIVTALGVFGEYLYIGAQAGLTRCWTEDGVWGSAETYCEPIEPETGFPLGEFVQAITAFNDTLYLASSLGVVRFQADNDTWHLANAGLLPGDSGDLTTHAFAIYQDMLLVGTQQGVSQQCP
ncbi:MAG: hypothetical protein HY696_05655 [Deltaproteobacteria bacterium]|nr:hypothetical protein [Deltaproteobacteria bacterium]